MSDLKILAELTVAEKNYRSRIEKAEKTAERILIEARNEANNIKKEGKIKEKQAHDKRVLSFKKNIEAERKKRYDEGIVKLDQQHPEDNENIDKSVEWLLDSIIGWLSMKGG